MRIFTLAFALENDAFANDRGQVEVVRILNAVAYAYNNGLTNGSVRDINGNLVGSYVVEENGK